MPKKRKKAGHTHSTLKDHKRDKKLLVPPFNTLGNVQLQSWTNDRLPEILWACLLTEMRPRDDYLAIFRSVSETAEKFRSTKAYITHSEIAKVTNQEFDTIFEAVTSNQQAIGLLAPLRLFPSLPDLHHWARWLPELNLSDAWSTLERAVARCLFHQSEPATDTRWLKARFLIIQHRIHFPETLKEVVVEILAFPNMGDLRKVRPSIRSMEGMTDPQLLDGTQPIWPEQFWKECLDRTNCIASKKDYAVSDFPNDSVNAIWGQLYASCAEHCISTQTTTSVDPRHDGVFGIALYALTLVASMFRPHSTRPAGRLLLRALVEAYLTLAYLVAKDHASLWKAYRAYGGGQAKLAYLKLLEGGTLPRYVDLTTLEQLASEDAWQEFVDIKLGHWADKDLRRMSEEVGAKDVYDKYYTWPSTFLHSQWPAVRNTVFEICLNPLHRLHRIPRPPRFDLEDVGWDAVKIGNLTLELVNQAYPPFKPRFRMPKTAAPRKGRGKPKVADTNKPESP